MKSQCEIEEKWSKLDPIFIRGMQRSGTSIIAVALLLPGFTHFAEGHLCSELMKPLSRFRDPEYHPHLKQPAFALGSQRNILLEKYIALAIDEFHRDNLPERPIRWVDKSPGVEGVEAVPMLAEVFPKSQFIFTYRNGTATVYSGLHLWNDQPGIFQKLCINWTRVMSTWRQVREEIKGRYIEIRQEELVANPESIAARLTQFLGVPEYQQAMVELFHSRRQNTAFPDKPPGDYNYELDWSNDQKAFFIEACAEEMGIWGYSIPFTMNPVWVRLRRWIKAWHVLRSGDVKNLWTATRQYLDWRLGNAKQ